MEYGVRIMSLSESRKKAVYETCSAIMYKHVIRFNKKHGNYLVRYCPKNQVIIMDTWNGAINQGHCTTLLLNGQFGPEGKVEYHSHISGKYNDFKFELEVGVDIFKSLLASLD